MFAHSLSLPHSRSQSDLAENAHSFYIVCRHKMAPPKFADLSKSVKDLFNDDFGEFLFFVFFFFFSCGA